MIMLPEKDKIVYYDKPLHEITEDDFAEFAWTNVFDDLDESKLKDEEEEMMYYEQLWDQIEADYVDAEAEVLDYDYKPNYHYEDDL